MEVYPAYALPNIQKDSIEFKNIEFGNRYGKATLEIPKMDKKIAQNVLRNLNSARNCLTKQSTHKISEVVKEITKLWLAPDFENRKMAEKVLPIILGFSPQMVRTFLDESFGNLSNELSQMRLPKKKDSTERVFCVLEEIPGPEMLAIVKALHNRSTIFCKSPSSEPLFAALYAQSFADVDQKIADCMAVVPWEGGKPEFQDFENLIYGETTGKDSVVVFGNIDTAESIKKKTNSAARLSQFTGGISFGVIGREILEKEKADSVAIDAALAVCMYDQRACFSPQLFYVERGGGFSPEEFAGLLARKMQDLEGVLPRGDLPLDASATFTELMSTYELQDLMGIARMYEIKNGGEPTGAVLYQEDNKFETSCLYRMVKVKPIDNISEIPGLVRLSPLSRHFHTIGIALDDNRKAMVEKSLKGTVAPRVTSIRDMYRPSMSEYDFMIE